MRIRMDEDLLIGKVIERVNIDGGDDATEQYFTIFFTDRTYLTFCYDKEFNEIKVLFQATPEE